MQFRKPTEVKKKKKKKKKVLFYNVLKVLYFGALISYLIY